MSIPLSELVAAADRLLTPQYFQDYCPNGLQVEGRREVRLLVTEEAGGAALFEAAGIDVRVCSGHPEMARETGDFKPDWIVSLDRRRAAGERTGAPPRRLAAAYAPQTEDRLPAPNAWG